MRFPYVRRVVLALVLVAPVVLVFSIRSKVASSEAPALVPVISATKTAALVAGNGDADADPGDTIEYTITVNNTGADPATGLVVGDTLTGPQSLVAGSPNILPNARNDTYQTIGNTQLQVAAAQTINPGVFVNGNVRSNDVDFDGTFTITTLTNAPTTAGGTVTLNTDGTFIYSPQAGDTAIADTFTYTVTDNQGGTDTATVTINILDLVWYVKNDAAAGGDGRSNTPFNTLAAGQTAAGPSTTIYVFNGNGTTSGQNAGTVMEANQRLIGEGVALTVPVSVNGGPNPTVLRAAGTAPMIDNTAGNAVAITNITGVLVTGLNIAATNSAVDVTTSGAGNAGAEIANNIIRASTNEGIDVNGASTGTTTVSIHDNSITSTGNGIDIARTAGTLNVTAFDDNAISGATVGSGINVVGTGGSVLFDAIPGTAAYDAVACGNTSVGQSGNGVGASGMVLNNVRGDISFSDLDIFSDNGAALLILGTTSNFLASGTGTRVTATAGTPSLVAVGGAAVDATDTNINLVPTTFSSSFTTAVRGVSLLRVSGTLTVPTGSTITSTTVAGTGFFIDGGSNANANVNVTYPGTINADIGRLVQIQNVTAASTHLFTGAITDNNDGDGGETGISLTGNTAATIRFSGGLLIRTTTNAAFTSTGNTGSTLEICDENPCGASGTNGALVNRITSTTGTALNVANTTIGASNLEFRSIVQNGGTNGIILNTTGTTGGLIVKGDATSTNNGSGGTIQSTSGAAVLLNNTRNVSLDQLNLSSTGGAGVQGTLVTNFTHTNSTFTGTGNAFFESGISFNDSDNVNTGVGDTGAGLGNNIIGTLTVTGNTFTNPFYSGLDVQSNNGTVTTANVSNNTITNPGFSGVNFVGTGTATTAFSLNDADIANNNITSSGGNGVQISISNGNTGASGAAAVAHAGFVTIDGSGRPVSVASNIVSITGNLITVDGGGTQAITVANSSASNAARTQTNFEILNNGTAGNPLDGSDIGTVILIGNNGFSDMAGVVNNNVIDPNHTPGSAGGGGNGIGGGNGTGGIPGTNYTPRMSLVAMNNDISDVNGNGILLVGRSTGTGNAYFKIANNTVDAPNNTGGSVREGIRVDAGNASSLDDAVYLNIFGNTSAGSNGTVGIGIRKQGTVQTTNDFGIFDAAAAPTLATNPTNAQVEEFIGLLNPGSAANPGGGIPFGCLVINGSNFLRDTTLGIAMHRMDDGNSAFLELAGLSFESEWKTVERGMPDLEPATMAETLGTVSKNAEDSNITETLASNGSGEGKETLNDREIASLEKTVVSRSD